MPRRPAPTSPSLKRKAPAIAPTAASLEACSSFADCDQKSDDDDDDDDGAAGTSVSSNGSSTNTAATGRFQRLLAEEDVHERAVADRERVHRQRELGAPKRSRTERAPFHEPIDVLSAMALAIERVSDVPLPVQMALDVDPELIYQWAVDAIISFGDERFEEGRATELSSPRRPVDAATAAELLAAARTIQESLS